MFRVLVSLAFNHARFRGIASHAGWEGQNNARLVCDQFTDEQLAAAGVPQQLITAVNDWRESRGHPRAPRFAWICVIRCLHPRLLACIATVCLVCPVSLCHPPPPPSLYLSLWPLPQVSPVAPRAVLQLRLECARDPEPGSPDHPLACGMLAEPKGGGRFCTSDMSVYLEFSTADPKFPSGKVTESVKITMFSEKPMVHRFLLWPASQKAMVLPLPAVREGDAGRDQRLRGAQQRAPLPCVPPPPVRAAFLWCLLSLLFKTGVACKPQNGIHLLLFRTHGVSLREPRRSIKILSHIPTSHIIVLLNAGRFHGGWGTQRDAPATDNGLPRVRRRHHGAIADAVSRVPGTREDAADLLRGTTGGAGGGGLGMHKRIPRNCC